LTAKTVLGSDGLPAHLIFAIRQEWHYATIFPESKPENCVEDGFLATWCALAGLLREGRVAGEAMARLRERRITPFAFFSTVLGGLLWSDDVKGEYQVFCRTYLLNLFRSDIDSAFGKRNVWRGEAEPRTPDDWVHYELIERCFRGRLRDWHDGRLAPIVHLSRPVAAG
jgi:hypothetical protein